MEIDEAEGIGEAAVAFSDKYVRRQACQDLWADQWLLSDGMLTGRLPSWSQELGKI